MRTYGHTPESYIKLRDALEGYGFDVQIPRHPSLSGARPPNAGLEHDAKALRAYLEAFLESGCEVIVLMHSYGGMVGTVACEGLGIDQRRQAGLDGGITNMIGMAACILTEGKAMIDMVKHFGNEHLMPLAFDFAEDMTVLSRDPKTLLIGLDSGPSDNEVGEYLSTLVPWNGQCMYDQTKLHRAAWRDIPITYLRTTKDMTMPVESQDWVIQGMRDEGVTVRTASLETGHCPNLTTPNEVALYTWKVAMGKELEADYAKNCEIRSQDEVRNAINQVATKHS